MHGVTLAAAANSGWRNVGKEAIRQTISSGQVHLGGTVVAVAVQGVCAASVVDMVADFKKRAIPIDGIGSQMHIGYSYPDIMTIKNNLTPLVGTGLLIHFSELDMSVNRDLALTTFTTERSNAQKEKYKNIAGLYKTIPAAQRFGITFWGVRDNDSWLRGWPVKTDYEWPLLFDSNYGYKPAYTGFFEGLK